MLAALNRGLMYGSRHVGALVFFVLSTVFFFNDSNHPVFPPHFHVFLFIFRPSFHPELTLVVTIYNVYVLDGVKIAAIIIIIYAYI